MSVWGNLAVRDKVQSFISKVGACKKPGPTKLSLVLELLGVSYTEFSTDRKTQDILGAVSHDTDTIYLNADLSDKDKHITLAHEIGHAVLHPKENMVDFRATKQDHLDDDQKKKEREANVFACELVLPYPSFIDIHEKFKGDTAKLSDYFLVPEKYIIKRINFLSRQVDEDRILNFTRY